MATQHATTGASESASKPQLLVVDFGKRQSAKQIKRLRKGEGKLMDRIDVIMDELAKSGAVKSNAQPVVIVVREEVPLLWPFK